MCSNLSDAIGYVFDELSYHHSASLLLSSIRRHCSLAEMMRMRFALVYINGLPGGIDKAYNAMYAVLTMH